MLKRAIDIPASISRMISGIVAEAGLYRKLEKQSQSMVSIFACALPPQTAITNNLGTFAPIVR